MQVYVGGRTFRNMALCDCGWHGTSRWTRASAVIDAGMHAAQTGHLPTSMPIHSAEPVLVLKAS